VTEKIDLEKFPLEIRDKLIPIISVMLYTSVSAAEKN